MYHHYPTLSLAALALAVSTAFASAPQPPAMKVAQPAGLTDFFPSSIPTRHFSEMPSPENASSATHHVLPTLRNSAMQMPRLTVADNNETMYGYLMATSIEDLKPAMYSLDLNGNAEFLWEDYLTGWGWSIYTGWLREDSFWGLAGVKLNGYFMGYALVKFNLENGNMQQIDYIDLEEEGMQSVFVSSAYRVFNDKVYGYSYTEEGDGMVFAMAPADDFHSVTILRNTDISEVCVSMAYNSLTDTMYGVTTTGDFVTIDQEGNQKVLYSLTKSISGLDARVASGMGWMPSLGACVYDAYFTDGTTALYALDPTAKSPVELCASPGAEIYSVLFSTAINAQPDAPKRATFKSYDFAATSLDGSTTWTMPVDLVEGTPIKGDVDYTLYLDGEEVNSGAATPGSDVTIEVKGVSNGQHTFAMVCSIDGYSSEPEVYHKWVGADAPLEPGNVKLTETLVTWDVPTGSAHDGYVDYSDINYTVYLNGRKIGDTKETSLSYTLPEGEPFTSYTAEVQATYKGWSSPRAASNFIQYGEPLEMPVHFRPEEKELEMMTLINVDGHIYDDGTEDTWRFTTEMGFPSFASGYNGDDWLILPPMVFDNTEKAYRFEMEIGLVHDVDTTGTYEVCIGKSPTAEAMTRVIIPESRCYHMLGDILEEFFAVPEAGVYYIGIHTKTNKVSFHVSDIDLSLTNRSAEVPVGVTGLEAIPGADGALTASVSFIMPLTTASGKPLPTDKELTATVSSYATEPGYDKERELVETKTLTGLPGSKQQIEIATAQNYNAIVVAITADGFTGKGQETLIYTGVDRPYIVNDLKATVSEDNMTMTLTWTRPTEGEDGGPIGDSFLYLIYDYISSSWQYLEEAGWDVYEYSYTVPENFSLGYLTLGVMAYNAAGLSYHVAGQTAALGHPVELPWTNDLDNDVTYDNTVQIRPTDQYNDTYWIPGDPAKLISPIFALPSNFAFIGYTSEATDRKTRLALPKVSTAGMDDVVLTFEYWGGRNAAPMRLMAEAPGMPTPVVIADLPADAGGWTSHTFKLPSELQDQGWVILYVDADLPDDQYFAMFSSYSFSTESGVDNAFASAPAITGGKGMITVTGCAGEPLIVTDLQGRTFTLRDRLGDHDVFFLPAGIYTVRAGSATSKIVVR